MMMIVRMIAGKRVGTRNTILSLLVLLLLSSCNHHHHRSRSCSAYTLSSAQRKMTNMIGTSSSSSSSSSASRLFYPTAQRKSRTRATSATTSMISMHMGHSHSHQDQDPRTTAAEANNNNQSQQPTTTTTTGQRVRYFAMYLFCACLAFVRPILQSRAGTGGVGGGGNIKSSSLMVRDVVAFVLASVSFRFLFEPVRNEVKRTMHKISAMKRDFAKHAPPPVSFFSLSRLLLSNTADQQQPNENEKGSRTTTTGGSMAAAANSIAADRVTILGGFINVLLSGTKFFIGVTCHSSALIADAGHSLSDLFSDFVTLWAVQVGRLPPDDDHPYGHGKFESIGALFLALILLGTGLSVGIVSNRKLIEIITLQRSGVDAAGMLIRTQIPTFPALIMAGISIASKEWMYRVTRKVGEQINSQVVIANAWHHRSDAYSSVLALFSIALAMAGLVVADAAAGLLVAGMICMTGAEILGESVKQLTDTNDEKLVKRVRDIAANSKDVTSVNRVRARQVGSSSLIDLSVSIPENKARSVSQAREIEERLRVQILQEDGVLDVDVKAICAADTTICATLLQQNEQLINSNGVYVNGNIISKAEVEACVRDEILQHHPEVQSVKGITIRYQDIVTNPIDVDVDISLQPEAGNSDSMTIASASLIAENVRQTLERSSQIHKASIFLDLNSNLYTSTTATPTFRTTQ